MADLKEFQRKMEKTLDVLASDFAAVRAGRANAQVLDRITVEYYGQPSPINQVGTVSSPDPRTLVIQPWDGSLLKAIEKAIQTSDLGINPQNDGRVIRLVFPQLTEERRKDLTKQVRKYAEDSKVAVRNIRRDAVDYVKKAQKKGELTEDAKNTVYLRPETAQGIFVNFNNVQRTTRKKLPFGIGQIGKSFRNEITPGNFIFRVREFEQMELEFFCKPGTDLEWFNYWRTFCHNWLLSIGLKDENLRLRDHDPEELCFYSKATTDFEFLFPFGWGELWGVADRTDYDLTQHQTVSGEKMVYREGEGKDMVEYVPYVIEPSLGVERSVLAVLCDAYDEEVVGQDKKGNDDVRVVLHFHPALAPFKAAILPLSKKEVLTGPAQELYAELSKEFMVDYDETGSIGKRYRREDEIGTPYCITFDFDTVGDEANGIAADHCVTIRERDSMEQVRVPISEVKDFLREKIAF